MQSARGAVSRVLYAAGAVLVLVALGFVVVGVALAELAAKVRP